MPSEHGPAQPSISVVIPTYQRPGPLADCLGALARQDFDRERFEVVVVDDGGAVALDAVVDSFRDRLTIRLLRQDNAGPGAARNTGAREARGRHLAFTDDDCLPEPGWLAALERVFESSPEAMVGGRIVNSLDDNVFAAASQTISDVAYDHFNDADGNARFISSNNMGLPAEVFREIGGFDASFRIASEDRELCDRWLSLGRRIVYAPDAGILHAHRLTFASFCRQHFNYGRGARRFHNLRAARGSGRLGRDVAFHGSFLWRVRTPLARMRAWARIQVAALLVVWQIANAAGFAYEAYRERGTA